MQEYISSRALIYISALISSHIKELSVRYGNTEPTNELESFKYSESMVSIFLLMFMFFKRVLLVFEQDTSKLLSHFSYG